MEKIIKQQEHRFLEYEFTATDLDSRDTITDVVLINENIQDETQIDTIIKKNLLTHPVASITGNTWEMNSWILTGKKVNKQIIWTEIQERKEKFQNTEYPINNFG